MAMNPRLLKPTASGFNPRSISGLALWLDAASTDSLYTTDAGAVTAVSSPLDIAGCVLWLDGADNATITASGGLVSQWNDKSASAAVLTSSGAFRPTLSSTGFNSRQAIVFNGTSTNMASVSPYTATNGLSAMTRIAVCQNVSGNSVVARVWNGGSDMFVNMNGSWRSAVDSTSGTNLVSSTSFSSGSILPAGVYSDVFSSATITQYGFGSAATTTIGGTIPSTTGTGTPTLHIGSNIGANFFWNGPIAEVIYFNRALTRGELARVEAYLAAKWGISGVHRSAAQEIAAVGSPLELANCALWLDASSTDSLYTTDAGPVTAISQPTDIGGCLCWYDGNDAATLFAADTGSTPATTTVGRWANKGTLGSSGDLVQAPSGSRPAITANALNSRPVITFDGTNDFLRSGAITLNQPYQYYLVFRFESGYAAASSPRIIDAGTPGIARSGELYRQETNDLRTYAGSTGLAAAAMPAGQLQQFNLYAITISSTAGLIRYKAGEYQVTGNAGTNSGSRLTLGADLNTVAASFANISVAEVIVFNSDLSVANRASVEKYLADKWGISGVHAQVAATNDPVGYWGDKSGNARHAKQTTGSYRPKINLAGMNGARSVQFSGGNNELLSLGDLSAALPSAGEVIVAFEPLSDTAYGLYETSASSSYFRIANGTSYFGTFSQSRQIAVSGSAPTAGRHIASIRCSSGGQQVVRIDGVQTFTGTPQGSGYLAGTSHVIGNNNNPAADSGLTGYIAEVICYNSILSDTDRARVEKYLAAKWGIANVPDPTPPVGYWGDKSGNGRHAVQATAGSRPTISANTQNSKKMLGFDGANGKLTIPFPVTAADPVAMIAVARRGPSSWGGGGAGGYGSFLNSTGGGGTAGPQLRVDTGNIEVQGGSNKSTVLGSNVGVGSCAIIEGMVSSLATSLYVQGALVDSDAGAGAIVTTGIRTSIGAWNDGTQGGGPLNGDIAELICYRASLTTSQRQRLERYLASKWGITLAPQAANADAQDWINRVYQNGGTVSSATAAAVNSLCDSLDSASLRNRFYRLNLFCGTGLNAALVPLYLTPDKTVTNLFQFGTDMTNPAWLAGGNGSVTRTATTEAGPLGYGYATKFTTPSAPFDVRQMYQQMPLTGQQATVSAWMKTSTGTRQIQWLAGNAYSDTVTVTSTWQRFTKTFTLPTATDARTGFSTVSELSDAAGFIYVWGMQCEFGPTATSYNQPRYGNATDTNNGPFVSGDYAETGASGGLTSNGTSKYLNTGFKADALTQTGRHLSVVVDAGSVSSTSRYMIGMDNFGGAGNAFWGILSGITVFQSSVIRSQAAASNSTQFAVTGKSQILMSGNAPATAYLNGSSAVTGQFGVFTAPALDVYVLGLNRNGSIGDSFNGRLQSYSIGEAMTSGQATSFYSATLAFQQTMSRA